MPDPFARCKKTLVGVVHLAPLPGAPLAPSDPLVALDAARRAGVADARALAEAGFDAVIVENLGDRPYRADAVPPETVAAMTVVAGAIRAALGDDGPALGINVLRNDARAALGIALATGASFIRVNVHTGVAAADQGMLVGRADETMRLRRALGADGRVAVLADVLVKHARTLSPDDVETATEDAIDRGLADGVIVTGATTGRSPDLERVERVAATARRLGARAIVGSGATAETVAVLLGIADGVIVGSSLKREGDLRAPIDPARAAAFVAAARPSS